MRARRLGAIKGTLLSSVGGCPFQLQGAVLTSQKEGRQSARFVVLGGVVVVLLTVGWFALSHVVMRTPVSDAVGEALGVGFALLIIGSILGAIRTSRGDRR